MWATSSPGFKRGVIVRLDGSGYRRIALSGELPEWTADGDSILYGRSARLHLVDTLGTGDRLLVQSGPTTSEVWASFSGDGQWVFFNDGINCQALYRARSDGSEAVPVTSTACDSVAVRASSSPDGSRATVWRSLDGIGILDVASGGITFIIPNCLCLHTNYPARWSPDGFTLAYARDSVLFLTTPDGAPPIQLTFPSVASYDALGFKWSPDSEWLIARQRGGLDLIRVQDGLRLPLGWSRRLIYPAWRP